MRSVDKQRIFVRVSNKKYPLFNINGGQKALSGHLALHIIHVHYAMRSFLGPKWLPKTMMRMKDFGDNIRSTDCSILRSYDFMPRTNVPMGKVTFILIESHKVKDLIATIERLNSCSLLCELFLNLSWS